jgi:hypothetical protein
VGSDRGAADLLGAQGRRDAPKDDEIFRRFRELATSEARQERFDALVEAYEEMGWVQR